MTHPFAGAKVYKSYTKEHEPLIWENMLGTVYAKGEYFDYDYKAAHKHAGVHTDYEDLRVCRVKYQYADWPRKGKWALFGVRKRTQDELRSEVERCERIMGSETHNPFWKRMRTNAIKKLIALQLKQFAK